MPDAIKGRKRAVSPLAQTKQRMVCLQRGTLLIHSWNEKISASEEGHRPVPKRLLYRLRACAHVCALALTLQPICLLCLGAAFQGFRAWSEVCVMHTEEMMCCAGGVCSTHGTFPWVLGAPGEAGETKCHTNSYL